LLVLFVLMYYSPGLSTAIVRQGLICYFLNFKVAPMCAILDPTCIVLQTHSI